MIQERDAILEKIKAHLLGRDETGAVNEPANYWDRNSEVEYERTFQTFLVPWTRNDLKLKCRDCGIESEGVSTRTFSENVMFMGVEMPENKYYDLCEKCYAKRCEDSESNGEDGDAKCTAEPVSAQDVKESRRSASNMIKMLKGLPVDQRIAKLEEMIAEKFEVAPGMEPAYEAYRAVLQKELDDAKTVLS